MDQKNICMSCMEEKTKDTACPHCGWVEGSAPESALHLPPGTILQEKYLIGRALGQGGFGITCLAWDMNLNLKLAVKEYLPQELVYRTGGQSEVSIYKQSLADNFNYGLEKFLEEARTLAQFNFGSVRLLGERLEETLSEEFLLKSVEELAEPAGDQVKK